jgi:hypothetical protein
MSFDCLFALSFFSLSRTLFDVTSIVKRGVSEFPSTRTPFPTVPRALRVLASTGTSTGSGLCLRRPILTLSCNWRTPSRQQRQFVPDKEQQERRHSFVPDKGAQKGAAPFSAEQ